MGASTHEILVDGARVTKRYRSWRRGEPEREWRALGLLDRFAQGLAPAPLAAPAGDPPRLVMGRLPGHELGEAALSDAQLDALASALERLHTSVPVTQLRRLPGRIWTAGELVRHLAAQLRTQPDQSGQSDQTHLPDRSDGFDQSDPEIARAARAAERWLASADAERLDRIATPVLAQADGNLANMIWDGASCRLVDFEDSGIGDRAVELADLLKHVSVTSCAAFDEAALLDRLDLDVASRSRVRSARALFATLWLVMLVPGGPACARNPAGSDVRQARRVLELLAG